MRGIIIAGGEIQNPIFIKNTLKKDDYIICLDSGLEYAHTAGITPSLIVGDFDSVEPSMLAKYNDLAIEILEFPRRKDFTDMEIGIDEAAKRGVTELLIFGALGGRTDHALGNIDNMSIALEKGMIPAIIDEKQHIFMFKSGREFTYNSGTIISLLPFSAEVKGVETFNLSYPLIKETLYKGYSRGISNVFTEKTAKVELESGVLIAIINV